MVVVGSSSCCWNCFLLLLLRKDEEEEEKEEVEVVAVEDEENMRLNMICRLMVGGDVVVGWTWTCVMWCWVCASCLRCLDEARAAELLSHSRCLCYMRVKSCECI